MATRTPPGSAVVYPVAADQCDDYPCTPCRTPEQGAASNLPAPCAGSATKSYGDAPADYPTICEDCCNNVTLTFPVSGGGTESRTLARNASFTFPCGSSQPAERCTWTGSAVLSSGTGLPTVRWVARVRPFTHVLTSDPSSAAGVPIHAAWIYEEWEETVLPAGGGCSYRLRRAVYADASVYNCPELAPAAAWADWPGFGSPGGSYTGAPDETGTTVSATAATNCITCDDGGV